MEHQCLRALVASGCHNLFGKSKISVRASLPKNSVVHYNGSSMLCIEYKAEHPWLWYCCYRQLKIQWFLSHQRSNVWDYSWRALICNPETNKRLIWWSVCVYIVGDAYWYIVMWNDCWWYSIWMFKRSKKCILLSIPRATLWYVDTGHFSMQA